MSCGDHFVETLRKVGYTKAPKLEGEDFDWLFETENRAFLDWFCATATEQNVLNDEKLQAFNSLKESGKGILDEKALEELLKTCKPANSKLSAMEEVPIDKLQEELEALQKQKTLYINRRNKLQMMASSNSHLCLKFKDKEEEDSKLLNEKLSDLKITNDKLNHELKSVIEGVEKLISFFSVPEAGCELQYEPVFLSQVVLDKYLSHEEQSTATLTLFTKEHFYNGFSRITESETFQPAGLNANSSSSDDTEDKCKEMMRLQLAYICAKNKLIQVKAKNASLKAGLQWVEDNVCAVQSKASDKEENMKTRISSLRNEVSQIQNHVDQINSETLPKLVREGAQLLTMPVIKGDYDQQITLQEMHIAKQDLICNHLMKQKTSFELLLLGYELELRKHRDVSRQLKTVIQDLQMISESVEKRLTLLNDASLSSTAKSRNNIDSKDSSSHRLSDLLEDNKMQKLFRTYSGLESVAQKLTKDIASLKDQLIVSKQEQSIILSKLDADLKSLSDFMYPKGKTVLLNTPELSSEFQLLESQLEKLNHIIVEVLGDLKAKRNILESGKLHKMEKELYVYFFKNKDHLRNIVENLESQAEILSST